MRVPDFSRNLWLLLAQNVAVFLGIALQALVLNLYLVLLGYREDFIGTLVFAQTAAIGLAALPASWLAPRIGHRLCLLIATATLSISFAAMALIEQAIPLIAASILNGVSMALIFVPSAPFLMENSRPDQRRTAFAANFAALSVASVLGSAIGGQMPRLIGGGELEAYRVALLVGAALTLLGVPPLLMANDRSLAEPAVPMRPDSGPMPARGSRFDFVMMGVSTGLLAASTGLVVAFFNVYLRDVIGSKTEVIGTIFAIASLVMAPASLGAPAMARLWGSVPVIALVRLACAPLILLMILWSNLWVAAIVYVVRSALMGISQPIDNASLMDFFGPRQRAKVAAGRTLAWNSGWAIATFLGGLAIVSYGYGTIFAAAAVLTVGSVAAHYFTFRGRLT